MTTTMPTVPLPPNDQPPAWFMPHWLDRNSWFWDAERRRHVIVLRCHIVQIVARKGLDWTWRVQRTRGLDAGVVSVGGFGFQSALDARRDALAEFWSDLWSGRPEHERWRQACAQRWPGVRAKAIADKRRAWAAKLETVVRASERA